MSGPSSGKNKSGRRSVKENGGMNVDGVEDSGADVSAAVEGVSFLHRFFYGDIIAWHGVVTSARGLDFCFIYGSCWDSPKIPPIGFDTTAFNMRIFIFLITCSIL
jgi:hypothetical protein